MPESSIEVFLSPSDLGDPDLRRAARQLRQDIGHRPLNPFILLIGGPSGAGKSSLALTVAALLGIRSLISTDSLRVAGAALLPDCELLANYSHRAWELVASTPSKEALGSGIEKQAEVLYPAITAVMRHAVHHRQPTIMEGVHLNPRVMTHLASDVGAKIVSTLLTASDDRICGDLLLRRTKSTYRHRSIEEYSLSRRDRLRLLNAWWNEQLVPTGIVRLENNSTPISLVLRLLGHAIEIFREDRGDERA